MVEKMDLKVSPPPTSAVVGVSPPVGAAMRGAPASPEERERLNNNGAITVKPPAPPAPLAPRTAFHSTRLFMLVFLSGWVLQGMFLTYFVSVTTTIEKLFKVESKTTGTLLAATEIGQICTALFLTYLAGRGHRPRWIAAMMLVLALGVLGCVAPHLLHGGALLHHHLQAHESKPAPLCTPDDDQSLCTADHLNMQAQRTSITQVVIPWLFICLLIVGVGQTGIATLGIPYVDDNVASKQSPLYMAITIGIRVIGPALGFLLGALCTSVYVDPLSAPPYDSTDARWVGAWWLGMVLIASLIVVLSLVMFLFPKQIKQQPSLPPPKPREHREPIFKDFVATIKRQLTNDILMWRTASSVLHLMPISGVYSFLPKYLEQQFRLPTHSANLVSGLGGILVMGVGTITSGVVILKLVPRARQVAAWTAFTALVYSLGMIALMFVSCPDENFRLLVPSEQTANITLECSSSCQCENVSYSPVCGQDSFTYLSPCQAGCENSVRLDNSTFLYYNCSCVNNVVQGEKASDALDRYRTGSEVWPEVDGAWPAIDERWGVAVTGACGDGGGSCRQLYVFVAIFALVMFVHASGEVGSVLLIIRCTDKQDKAMAMGVIQFAIGAFGNVPCPIVFGACVDAACRLRDALCGATSPCHLYHADTLRHYYLGLSAALMFLAFIADLQVWRKAGRIDMNPAEPAAPPVAALDATPLASYETNI